MVPDSYNTQSSLSPNFICLIISGVGLFCGLIGHAVSVFLPLWNVLYHSLWHYSHSAEPAWVNAVRAMEILGFLVSLVALALFIVILVKSSSIQHSGLTVERGVNIMLFLFMSALFLAGLFIFIGIFIAMSWFRLNAGCVLSGTAGVLFLLGAGLSATAVADLNMSK